MNNIKDIAEKILNFKTYDIPDIQTLARAYLELKEKNLLLLKENTLLILDSIEPETDKDVIIVGLKEEITKLKEENEKLKQLFAVQIDLVEYGKKLEEEINKPKEHKKHKDFVICKYVANNHSNYLKTVFRNDYISHINYGMECLCEDKCYYNKELKK